MVTLHHATFLSPEPLSCVADSHLSWCHLRHISSALLVAICTPYCFNIPHLHPYVCFVGFFHLYFFFLMISRCLVDGFRIFLQLNQSFHFEMQFSLRKCINSISSVPTCLYKIIVLCCFVFPLWSGVCIWRQNLLWRTKRNCVFKLRRLCSVWVQGKKTFDGIKILACWKYQSHAERSFWKSDRCTLGSDRKGI